MGQSSKKTLYLMRHGQTIFNERRRIQGSVDSALTKLGIEQAKIAKKYFIDNKIEFTHAYSSTQERASDTLEIITDLSYTRLKGIKEMNFGIFDGESEDFHPPKLKTGGIFGEYYKKFGGESESDVRKRAVKTLIEIMEKDGHNTVLAVSHGLVCSAFFAEWHPNKSLQNIPNCTIFKYEYSNGIFKNIEIFKPDFSGIEL